MAEQPSTMDESGGAPIRGAANRDAPTRARGRQEGTVAHVVRLLRRDRVAGYTAVGLVAVVVTALVGLGGGHRVLPRISDIGAWLANDRQGSVTHANGISGKADTRVTLTNAAGHPLTVSQDGDTVIVLDTVTGQVTRIDPVRLTVAQSASYGSAKVQIAAGAGVAYVVDPARGLVQQIDPDSLRALGPPVAFTAPLGAAAVDTNGTLWVPVPHDGTLAPVTAGRAGSPVSVGTPGDPLTLTMAGGVPVVADVPGGTVTVLSPAGRRTVNLPAGLAGGSTPAVLAPARTDGAVVPLLSVGTHQLVVLDSGTATPTSVNLDGFGGHDLGAPQAFAGRVYIPDASTGRLIVYDAASGTLLNQITVTGHAGRLETFERDGMLWVNDAQGSVAVSIDAAGAVHQISKYTPDLPGGPLPSPSHTPSAPPRNGSGGSGHGSGSGGGGSGHGSPPSRPGRGPTTGAPRPGRTAPSPSPSEPAPAPTLPPDSPHTVTEKPGAGTVEVTFTPSGGATPTSYTLSGVPAGASVDPASIGADGPYHFTVTGLPCTRSYAFTVVAHYPTGSKSASGGGAWPCVAPSPPTGLRLDGGTQHQVTAAWRAPDSDGGGQVHYAVSLDGGTAVDVSGTSKTFTGLKNFTGHTVSVSAVNGAGRSAPPSSASATISHATWTGTIGNNSELPVNERDGHDTGASIVKQYPVGGGQKVQVVCVENGGSWEDPTGDPKGSTWYRIASPPGWIASGYVLGASGVWSCDGKYG